MHLPETIGNTPLIELRNTTASTEGRLLFKYERGNPGGSIKDRPALFIVTEAEKRGLVNLSHLKNYKVILSGRGSLS